MTFAPMLSIGLALALCVVPVLVLQRRNQAGAADGAVPPAIIRNAWIAYAVRVSVFVPLFLAGATGDIWPVIAAALGLAAGIAQLGTLHGPLAASGSPTLHAYLAQGCEDAAKVRLATAAMTVLGLLGLAGAEAAALVAIVSPLTGEGAGLPLFVALFAGAGLYAVAAGANRVRYASQALLGAIFVGVFVSAAFLLYLHASDLRPLPPYGAFALITLAAGCLAIMVYRQNKYNETPPLIAPEEPARWRRKVSALVKGLLKVFNIAVSIFAVVAIVIAGMEFYFLGLADNLLKAVSALTIAPTISTIGLAAIALLALTYPLVDAVSWQNVGALKDSAAAAGDDPAQTRKLVIGPIRFVAGETALFVLMLAAIGTITTLGTDLPPEEAGMPGAIRQLVLFENEITSTALTLLLVGTVAMAVSMMGTAFASALTAIRLDILPSVRAEPGDGAGPASGERRAVVVLVVLAIVVAAIWLISGVPSSGAADTRVFALALAFACLQLSLLPLVVARVRGFSLPNTGAARSVLGGGVAAALACLTAYGVTDDLIWLWLAVPACLATGLLIAVASIVSSRQRRGSPDRSPSNW